MVTLSGISRLVDSGAGDATVFFFFPMAGVREAKEGKIQHIRVIVAEPLEVFFGFGYVREN